MEPFNAKLIAASTGSALTALTMTPFDVVKTRLQTQPPARPTALFPKPPRDLCCQPGRNAASCVRNMSSVAQPLAGNVVCIWEGGHMRTERVTGFVDAVKHVWKAEGIRGLWKGTGTSLAIGVPAATCYMLAYDHLQNDFLPQIMGATTFTPLAAGMTARASVTSLVSPLELVRTNLQSTPISPDCPNTLPSVLASIRTLVRLNGPGYLWRGLGTTLWRDVPFSGLYWVGYESGKRLLRKRGYEGVAPAFASGATSGIFASLVTSPFDVMKTRRQAMIMSNSASTTTATFPLIIEVLRTEGASALFAGIGPRMIKIAPACGIMIACYEGVGKLLTAKPKRSPDS